MPFASIPILSRTMSTRHASIRRRADRGSKTCNESSQASTKYRGWEGLADARRAHPFRKASVRNFVAVRGCDRARATPWEMARCSHFAFKQRVAMATEQHGSSLALQEAANLNQKRSKQIWLRLLCKTLSTRRVR